MLDVRGHLVGSVASAFRFVQRGLRQMTKSIPAATSPDEWKPEEPLVLSYRDDGFVWASWQNGELALRLGQHDSVVEIMREFLAQDALADLLTDLRHRAAS